MTFEQDKYTMPSDVASVLAAAAAADPSYAGPFAYDSQTPMKTFMGQVPCVPLPTLLEAERGGTHSKQTQMGPQDIESLRKVIGMDVGSCGLKCAPWQCIADAPGTTLSDKLRSSAGKACMNNSTSCYQSCIAHN